MARLLCLVTAGQTGQDVLRVRRLTKNLDVECTVHCLDRSASRLDNLRIAGQRLNEQPWDLVYQEGTGIAGGLALIHAARTRKLRYVVSSGDPVGGFFRTVKGPLHGALFEAYEKQLYRHSAGFIGWTPYLTGVAMKMGAPRSVTVEGAVDLDVFQAYDEPRRRALKARYGLDPNHVVCGVVGSLTWTPRQQYCYGLELVALLPYLQRPDVSVLIVGDGDGRPILEARVPDALRDRVVFAGRVPEAEVVDALNAMDVGFITQTLDALGRYRLTTKLPEYLATGLPVAMSPIPGYYDYALAGGWPLPAHHPANAPFHQACAGWLDTLSREEITRRRARAREIATSRFAYDVVRTRFEAFITDLLRPTPVDSSGSIRTGARAQV